LLIIRGAPKQYPKRINLPKHCIANALMICCDDAERHFFMVIRGWQIS
jgi:hypothetical protein